MALFAELADGRRLEFPDGTDPSVVQATVKKVIANTQASVETFKSPVAPDTPEQVSQKLAKAKQGLADIDNMAVPAPNESISETLGLKVPDGVKKAFPASRVLDLPIKSTIQGAASGPVSGAIQMGADALEYDDLSAKISKNAKEGNMLGAMLQPEAWLTGGAAGKFIGKGANWASKAVRASLPAGAYGAGSVVANPTDSKISDRVKQGAVSAATALVASPVVAGASRGVQHVADALRRRAGKVNAGNIARTVAGDSLDDIKALNAQAPDSMTSAQATLPANRDVWQSLGEMAKGKDQNSHYRMLDDAQKANRISAMEAVKPDLKTAIADRKATTEPFYQVADKEKIVIDKDMNDVFKRMPKGVMAKAAEIAKMEGRDFKILNADDTKSMTGESLHYIKRALSDKANASTMTGIGQDEIAATKSVLKDFIKVFEEKIPAYGTGRKLYAEGSKPVNQSKVIDAMIETLKPREGVTESSTAFLNAMGKGENSLIKRADQSPRFGGIDEILNAPQKSARDKVVSELIGNEEVNRRAIASAGGLADIVGDKTFKAKLPQLLDAKFAIANKALSSIEAKVNKNTMKAIIEGMKNGKNANEMLNTLPSGERLKVIQALKNQKAIPFMSGAITATQQQGGQ